MLANKERVMMTLEPMSDADKKTVLSYMQKYGYRAMDECNYPDLDTKTGIACRTTCKQCHELPEPSIHTKEEWRDVALRMRKIMEILDVTDPSAGEIAKVINYLQSHAKG